MTGGDRGVTGGDRGVAARGQLHHLVFFKVRPYVGQFKVHPRQTCSFQRQLDSRGKHSATLQLLREDCPFTYPPLSIVRYSFIIYS